jgi:hypothetical protein
MSKIALSTKERFWAKVSKQENGCWIWMGTKNEFGQARFHYRGRFTTAPRVAYEFAYGPPPKEKWVLHQCDNSLCVNPAHLSLGTAGENAKQRATRGRSNPLRGENAPAHKLTENQVAEIRAKYARGGVGFGKLAKEYKVGRTTIIHIVQGKSWKTG